MRQSQLLGRTRRDPPRDAQSPSHRLLVRAGYIQQLSAGVYSYLPLMHRVLERISAIVREEMNRVGCQELLLPALQPTELWQRTERWERYTAADGIMFTFQDRRGATCCLGPTHEEVVTEIARAEIQSYKDLPKILYQIQTKFRDEIRPRFALMRAREFIMKDAYSFDADEQGMRDSFNRMDAAYHNICRRIGFRYRAVEADAGAIGGEGSREFMVLADTGEDLILHCSSCDYAANIEKATSRIELFEQDPEQLPKEDVFGEGLIGVEALAEFLQIPVWKTTKTLLYEADGEVVAVMVRGDCDVNEVRVQNFLNCTHLQLASPEVVRKKTGAEVGYAGPINLPPDVKVIADHYVGGRVNFECGANATNYHSINVNFERDLPNPQFGDFKLASPGDRCSRCQAGHLESSRGIEVGHIFQLGTKYSEKLEAQFLDEHGKTHPLVMGCYGIGISRMAAAVVEQNHDENGIIWPGQISPFDLHLIALNLERDEIRSEAIGLYDQLTESGYRVLFDDREIRAGEKFSDADLIGISLRVTVSRRSLKENAVEMKRRDETEASLIPIEEFLKHPF